jgi:N-acetylglucosaminyldiphosphoundecaprenol N-acetyl-beta-D-mannosaminyltransferase
MNTRYYLQGVPVDLLSKLQALEQINNWLLESKRARHIVTLNALILVTAIHNPELNQIIQAADLITIDGYGILKALRKMDYQFIEQFTGIDLTREVISRCARYGYPVYIYGGSPIVASNLRLILSRNWPELVIVGIRDGYGGTLDQNRIFEEIIQNQPALLLVGLGSPDQELFLAKILPKLNKTIGIGVGGTLDILAGLKKEAPRFLRNHGWEWLYRMMQDPVKLKRIPDLFEFWYWCLR